jgi:hypothetical protein
MVRAMTRGRPVLAVLALAAFGLAACGDDDTDQVSIPDEITTPDISLPDVSIPDEITLPDISIPDEITLPDISLPDVSLPDISLPDLSVPEQVEDAIRDAFPDLEDAQIDCLVDAIEGENAGIDDIFSVADQCDISVGDLVPGG